MARINEILNKLEKDNNITVIYAVEAGSRVWGFGSDSSDYDVRFVYKHNDPVEYIMMRTDNTTETITGFSDDKIYDWQGWDITKAMSHLKQSNPSIIEWLYSPIIYINRMNFQEMCLKLLSKMHSKLSLMYHYKSIAWTNWETHINITNSDEDEVNCQNDNSKNNVLPKKNEVNCQNDNSKNNVLPKKNEVNCQNDNSKNNVLPKKNEVNCKKYFYVIRPIATLQYLMESNNGQNEIIIDFNILLNKLIEMRCVDKDTVDELNKLISLKKSVDKMGTCKRIEKIDKWIIQQFNRFDEEVNANNSDSSYDEKKESFVVNSMISVYKKLENETKKIIQLTKSGKIHAGLVSRSDYLNAIGLCLQFLWLIKSEQTTSNMPTKIFQLVECGLINNDIREEINKIINPNINTSVDDDDVIKYKLFVIQQLNDLMTLVNIHPEDLNVKLPENTNYRSDLVEYHISNMLNSYWLLTHTDDKINSIPKNIISDDGVNSVPKHMRDKCKKIIEICKPKNIFTSNIIINDWLNDTVGKHEQLIKDQHRKLLEIKDKNTQKRYNDSLKKVNATDFNDIIKKVFSY